MSEKQSFLKRNLPLTTELAGVIRHLAFPTLPKDHLRYANTQRYRQGGRGAGRRTRKSRKSKKSKRRHRRM